MSRDGAGSPDCPAMALVVVDIDRGPGGQGSPLRHDSRLIPPPSVEGVARAEPGACGAQVLVWAPADRVLERAQALMDGCRMPWAQAFELAVWEASV